MAIRYFATAATSAAKAKTKKSTRSEVRQETMDTWKQIAATKNYHLTQSLANELYNAAWTGVTHSLIKHGRAYIPNIGTFTIRYRKERLGRNPLTGEKLLIPANHIITFQPATQWVKEVIEQGKAKAPVKRPPNPQALKLKQAAMERKAAKQSATTATETHTTPTSR
jgi:nucleoid DNA-binding protein